MSATNLRHLHSEDDSPCTDPECAWQPEIGKRNHVSREDALLQIVCQCWSNQELYILSQSLFRGLSTSSTKRCKSRHLADQRALAAWVPKQSCWKREDLLHLLSSSQHMAPSNLWDWDLEIWGSTAHDFGATLSRMQLLQVQNLWSYSTDFIPAHHSIYLFCTLFYLSSLTSLSDPAVWQLQGASVIQTWV
jgi:hypothetical protein